MWNVEVTNQEGLLWSDASNTEATMNIHRINEDGTEYESDEHADNMRIVWSDVDRYIVPFNQGLTRPLEVLRVAGEKKFQVRHERGDVSPFAFGLYTIKIRVAAQELRKTIVMIDRRVRIPEDLASLGT